MATPIPTPSARTQYSEAQAAQHTAKDLAAALDLYEAITIAHPASAEADYAREQIRNIARRLIPKDELDDALMRMARNQLGREAHAIERRGAI